MMPMTRYVRKTTRVTVLRDDTWDAGVHSSSTSHGGVSVPSQSSRCKPTSPFQSQWSPNEYPLSCIPLAPVRTCDGWRTAAASRWWNWYTTARSRWTRIIKKQKRLEKRYSVAKRLKPMKNEISLDVIPNWFGQAEIVQRNIFWILLQKIMKIKNVNVIYINVNCESFLRCWNKPSETEIHRKFKQILL